MISFLSTLLWLEIVSSTLKKLVSEFISVHCFHFSVTGFGQNGPDLQPCFFCCYSTEYAAQFMIVIIFYFCLVICSYYTLTHDTYWSNVSVFADDHNVFLISYPPPNLRELSLWQLFLGLLVVLISVFWLPALPFLVSPLLLMASSPPPFPEVDCFLSTPSVRYRYTTRAGN